MRKSDYLITAATRTVSVVAILLLCMLVHDISSRNMHSLDFMVLTEKPEIWY